MKKLFVLFIISSLNTSLFLCCMSAQSNEPFSSYTFSALAMSSINAVEASTLNGSLTVSGNANTEIVVEMYVSRNRTGFLRRARTEKEIKQHLVENYTIEVKLVDEKLLVAAKQNDNKSSQISISFKIIVPRQMNSNLETTNGSVQISNLTGSHKFETVNGSLKVENVSGKIYGSTTNGSITVTNSNDDINLSTVNGSITEIGCSGKINLTTVNGKVNGQSVGFMNK